MKQQIKLNATNTIKQQAMKDIYTKGFNKGYNFLKDENKTLKSNLKAKKPSILDDICTMNLDNDLLDFLEQIKQEFSENKNLDSMCVLEAIINAFTNLEELDKQTGNKYQFSNVLKYQTLQDINKIAKSITQKKIN